MSNLITKNAMIGTYARLENLSEEHFDGLKEIVEDAGDQIFVHTHLGGSFEQYFDKALVMRSADNHAPFVVRHQNTNKYIGMTRLFSDAPQHKICEIGYTWYHPSVWGGKINPEAKLLLLQHAFETCGMRRVQFSTDLKNLRSQAAIQKLGAKPEGVLRKHRILPDGTRRDSPIFSIIDDEWADVRKALYERVLN